MCSTRATLAGLKRTKKASDQMKSATPVEAMIVTGELVKNLGTNKFIPIVRQTAADPVVPRSVSTRIYVNLSIGKNEEKEFEKLVRDIHQTPKTRKPALGKNPYEATATGISMAGNLVVLPTGFADVNIEDAESAYLCGLEIARSGDFTAWRQLVRKVKEPLSATLIEWKKKYDGAHSMAISALPEMVLQAATIYSPLMAVALAGVESGQPKFNNQVGVLDELLRPKGWNAAGLTVVGSIPDALVFTYQSLHGAACLEVGELSLGVSLSRARVARAHHYEGVILYQDQQFSGWPESFNHTCTTAWRYLISYAAYCA